MLCHILVNMCGDKNNYTYLYHISGLGLFGCFFLDFFCFSVWRGFPFIFLIFPSCSSLLLVSHWFSIGFSHSPHFFLVVPLVFFGFFIGCPSVSSFLHCFPLVFLRFSLVFLHFPHLLLDFVECFLGVQLVFLHFPHLLLG